MSAPSPSLLRSPDFLKLWSAETVSQIGTQVSLLAVPLVAILVLQASPFEVALLGTIEFLPFIIFSLPAGTLVDRLRRRPILIAGDLVRAASLASIPIAYELGALSILQLYVVGFVTGIATVFFDVSYQSYLPAVVERDQLVEGNSKLEISRSGAQILGPGMTGVLIGWITAPLAILVDSISYLGSAAFLFLIRRPEPTPDRHLDEHGAPRSSIRQETVDGLRYVLRQPFLRSIAACTASSNLFSQLIYAILLVYLVRQVGLKAETIGFIYSIAAVGPLAAAFLSNRIAVRIGVGPTIVWSAFLFGPANLLVAFAPQDVAIPFLTAGVLISGFSGVVYNVNQVSLRQAITPERMQGRMNATMRFLVWGTIPIGSIIAGALGSTVGLRETIAAGGLLSLIPFLFVLLSPVRSIGAMPTLGDSPGPQSAEAAGEGRPVRAPGATDDGIVVVGHEPLVGPHDG
jgi:MFS family permease